MSCRRGTPRNDCGCCKSLAEKVRELYQRCANAIKSINGINPDGANNFDILPGAGIQVNPRANGIEIVATGAAPQGIIETINSEGPDSDGNFAITAGSGIQINTGTNGLEIENTSQGAVYTGVSPIAVNADNEISLKEWVEDGGNAWDSYLDQDNNITEDIILITKATYIEDDIYIPKGTPLAKIPFNPITVLGTSSEPASIGIAQTTPTNFYNFVFSQTDTLYITAHNISLPTKYNSQSTIFENIRIDWASSSFYLRKTGGSKNIYLYKRGSA